MPIAKALRRVGQEDHFRRPSLSASLDNPIGNNFSPDFLPRGYLPEDAPDRCARSPASELSGGEEFTVMKNLELLQQGFGNSGAKRPTAEGAMAGKHLPGSLLGSPYRPVRKNPGLSESCRGTNRRFRQKLPLAFGKNCRNGFSFPHFRSWPKQNRSRIGLDDSLKARPPCGSNCFSLLYLQTSVTP